VSVQSMTNTDTRDAEATTAQIRRLQQAGCEVVRVAVPDSEAADALRLIRRATEVPLVADIHFDYRLALASIEAGVDKLRINPGNIGNAARVSEVAIAARSRGIPIRIGVNLGSLPRELVERYGRTARAMTEAALGHIGLLEREGFHDIVVSLKASDVPRTVQAYRMLSTRIDYPLHVGVTEAGPPPGGLVKSAVGIGIILGEGIGDTIRVSLTGDPALEVSAGREILAALELRSFGPVIVSCPTCGRRRGDVVGIVSAVREAICDIAVPMTVAVMGCEVNGPGEAQDADVGLACGRGVGVIFMNGRVVRRVSEEEMVPALLEAVRTAASAKETTCYTQRGTGGDDDHARFGDSASVQRRP
jgi:(E)-4-hydroxy-3-methylbut-2-enyl-diphosphate synthase